MHPALLVAAAAEAVAVVVHGGVGHRWLRQQLAAVELPPSALFGDADVGERVLLVSWHVVTAVFVVCGAALLLAGLDAVDSPELLRLVAALHGAFLLVGLAAFARRLDALVGRVPPVFVGCMVTVALTAGLSAR